MPIQTVVQRKLFKWDEINRFWQELTTYTKPKEQAKKDFEDLLVDAYIDGFAAAAYLLGEDFPVNPERVYAAINKKYDGQPIADKFTSYYEARDTEGIIRLVESEFHRANEQGGYDAASQSQGNVGKRWVSILDSKTRFTHEMLDGVKVGINDWFYSLSGDRALFPGGFQTAEENCNCRCTIEYIAAKA